MSTGQVCCSQWSELPYQNLEIDASRREEIDVKTPAYAFAQGRSRFIAYRLPQAGQNLVLRVKSTIVGIDMPKAFVFYPGTTFLDANFSVIGHVNPKMIFEGGFMASTASMGWTAGIDVPAQARHVIFHYGSDAPRAIYYKEGAEAIPGTVVPVGKSAIYLPGNWWDVYLPTAGAGRLQVKLISVTR